MQPGIAGLPPVLLDGRVHQCRSKEHYHLAQTMHAAGLFLEMVIEHRVQYI